MASYKRAFPTRFFRTADWDGELLVLTVKEVRIEEVGFGQDTEEKLVCYFVEDDRGLVLNRTNADTMAEISGKDDEQDWAGLRVELVAENTKFAGKKVLGLRLRAAPAPVVEDLPDDDLPF